MGFWGFGVLELESQRGFVVSMPVDGGFQGRVPSYSKFDKCKGILFKQGVVAGPRASAQARDPYDGGGHHKRRELVIEVPDPFKIRAPGLKAAD